MVRTAGGARLHRRVERRDRRVRRAHATGAGRGVDTQAPAGGGHYPRLHPGAGPDGPERSVGGRGGPRALLLRAGHVLQRDRGTLERHRVLRALQASPGHPPLPARRPRRREGRRGLRDVHCPWIPPGSPGGEPSAHLLGRSATGHAPAGRRGGRRRHHQLVVGRRRGHCGSPRWTGQGHRRPDLCLPHRGRGDGPGRRPAHDRRLSQRGGVRPVPPVVGSRRPAATHVVGLAGRGPKGRPGRHPR